MLSKQLSDVECQELLKQVRYISDEMRDEKMAREAMYKDTERLRVIDYTVKEILNNIEQPSEQLVDLKMRNTRLLIFLAKISNKLDYLKKCEGEEEFLYAIQVLQSDISKVILKEK